MQWAAQRSPKGMRRSRTRRKPGPRSGVVQDQTQRSNYALSEMCPVLEVSISGYRDWKRGGRADWCRLTDARMQADPHIVTDALTMAWFRRKPL